MCSCVSAPVKHCFFVHYSPVSEPGDWGPVPQAVATKARVSDLYASSFQGDTGGLVVLLEQAGGRRQGRCSPVGSCLLANTFHALWGRLQAATRYVLN